MSLDDIYDLDANNRPILCKNQDRKFNRVDYVQLRADRIGEIEISTIFLRVDHGFGATEEPILFETMVFYHNSDKDDDQERFCSYEEAIEWHEEKYKDIISELKNGTKVVTDSDKKKY